MKIYNNQRYLLSALSLLFLLFLFQSRLQAQVTDLEIWQIQGAGARSTYNGMLVQTAENVVTAVGDQFFYIQTPADRTDGEAATSDGIMVFTGFSPGVRPGDLVTVTGRIQEFNGQTQFGATGLAITLVNTQQALPDPVDINAQFPAGTPGDLPDLEQVEGMLVQISGITTGPSNEFGWFPLRGGDARSFREPGVAYPGLDGLPVWDGNPEVFWMDPDGVGARDMPLVTGGTRVEATAVLGENSTGYLALPVRYELTGGITPAPVRSRSEDEITVASINTLQLIPGTTGYSDRIRKMARYLHDLMRLPDIIAFQELGSKRTLDDLVVQLDLLAPERGYDAYLVDADGNLELGYLVSESLTVTRLEQLGEEERLSTGGRLHDRPPLLLEVRVGTDPDVILRVINVHIRSLRGIDGDNANFVRIKRLEQAMSIGRMVQEWQDENLLLVGDFNAFEFTDGYVDVVSQIQGTTSLGALFPLQNIVNPPLQNVTVEFQPPEERYSFVFEGNAQLLDHCIRNDFTGLAVRDLVFVRNNADQPAAYFDSLEVVRRISDHDGFVVFLSTDTTVPAANQSLAGVSVNFPNPISDGDIMRWTLDQTSEYRLLLVDGLGRTLTTTRGSGDDIRFQWPEGVAPGWYAVHLQTERGIGRWKVIGR